MENYETRRARRLKLEQERRQRRRRTAKKFAWFLVLIVVAVCGFLIWRAIENTSSSNQARIETDKLAEQQKLESSPTYIIKRDLSAQIAAINQNLGLPGSVNTSDLPTTNAVAVKLIDLSDKNRGTVDYNGDTQFTSASTYKLFVAYAMIHAVETGQMKWTSSLNDTTLDNCFNLMITDSDNNCPEAYLSKIGFSKFNSLIDAIGVSEQTQFSVDNMRTSANDLALFLQKLYKGELMTADNQQKLINLMKGQIYRKGIPAGILARNQTTGRTDSVADKVGFLDTLLHDAGIVYSGQGDYVLVIMTNGESWPFIAQLTTWVDGQLGQ